MHVVAVGVLMWIFAIVTCRNVCARLNESINATLGTCTQFGPFFLCFELVPHWQLMSWCPGTQFGPFFLCFECEFVPAAPTVDLLPLMCICVGYMYNKSDTRILLLTSWQFMTFTQIEA